MGRSGCSSCCKQTFKGTPACTLDNYEFIYKFSGRELNTSQYAEFLAGNKQNPNTPQKGHEDIDKVLQYISKADWGEYKSEVNAYGYNDKFDVTATGKTPTAESLKDNLNDGYLTPLEWRVNIGPPGKNIIVTRKLTISKVDLISPGEHYGIADHQFTEEGLPVGASLQRYGDGAVEKGCPAEESLKNDNDSDVGAFFLEKAPCAARGGSVFQQDPYKKEKPGNKTGRTYIQIKRTTFVMGFEQTISGPGAGSINWKASLSPNLSRGIPVRIEYRAYNYGQELFKEGKTCCGSAECMPDGLPYVLDLQHLLDKNILKFSEIEDLIKDYHKIQYCLTYPFLKMYDNETYWFNAGGTESQVNYETNSTAGGQQVEPALYSSGPPAAALHPTHHNIKEMMTYIDSESERFIWFNPFNYDPTKRMQDSNGGFGRNLTASNWKSGEGFKKMIAPTVLAAGDNFNEFVEKIKAKLEAEQQDIGGPYFDFVDNKLKGNEYDIPQKMFTFDTSKFPCPDMNGSKCGDCVPRHYPEDDVSQLNIFLQILQGSDVGAQTACSCTNAAGQPGISSRPYSARACRDVPDHRLRWQKWHENIIVVARRSEDSAANWAEKRAFNETIGVGDEVYHPIGSCNKKHILDVLKGPNLKAAQLTLSDNSVVTLHEVELVKDKLTYGMDGRTYRMWQWLNAYHPVGKPFTMDPYWYEKDEEGEHILVDPERYNPFTHKIKSITYHNHSRPFPVLSEISSYGDYPSNDTYLQLTKPYSWVDVLNEGKMEIEAGDGRVLMILPDDDCPVSGQPYIFDYRLWDDDNAGFRTLTHDFSYTDDDGDSYLRRLTDDNVILTTRAHSEYEKVDPVKCGAHWEVEPWISRQSTDPKPGKLQQDYFMYSFNKEQDLPRKPTLNKKVSVDHITQQLPHRGYFFTEDNYTVIFDFETIEDWRERMLAKEQ